MKNARFVGIAEKSYTETHWQRCLKLRQQRHVCQYQSNVRRVPRAENRVSPSFETSNIEPLKRSISKKKKLQREASQKKREQQNIYFAQLPKNRVQSRTKKTLIRQAVEPQRNKPNSRQKQIIARARTNQAQQIRLNKRQEERGRAEQQQRERLRMQRNRERQLQRRERQIERQQQRARQRVAFEQQRQENQRNQNMRRRNRRQGVARSAQNRRGRRQNSFPRANFFPFEIFHRIEQEFDGLRLGTSFGTNIQNFNQISHHFSNLMQNFSNMMMSPTGNHRRRVIWFQQGVYPEDSYNFELISQNSVAYSEDQGLDQEQIDEIPVHQFNSRRHNPNSDTTCKSCAVCLSDFIHGDSVKVLYCTHKFHHDCIDRWLELKGNCPVCRQNLRNN